MASFTGEVSYKRSPTKEHPYLYWSFGDWGHRVNYDDPSSPYAKSLTMAEQYTLFGALVEAIANGQVNDYRTAYALQLSEPKTYRAFITGGTFYPLTTNMTGAFEQVPKPLLGKFPDIRTNNQPRYSHAKHTGDIVVSNYQAGTVKVEFEPAIVLTHKSRTNDYYMPLHKLLNLPTPSLAKPVKIGGGWFSRLPSVVTTRQEATATESLGDYNFAMDEFTRGVISGLCSGDATTSKCVASANGGTVDLATSLAEAPKTGVSIQRGCALILKMYKDTKNRELRLQDQVKRVRHAWNKELSRAQNIQEKDAAAHATKILQFEKTSNNLLHELASIWLTYRLEILPTAKSIEASIDGLVLGKAKSKFVRFRENERCSIPYMDASIPVEFRCFIKRSLISGAEWQSYFSVNITKTLWELAWLSFVVDRYMSIGDWILGNLSRPSAYTLQEGATKSWKIDTVIRVPGKRITIKFNRRLVFSTDSYCPLYFPSSRTSDQTLDHLALAWAILVKKL